MKSIIVLTVFCSLAVAQPGYLAPLVSYGYLGVPLPYDGRVLESPEVAQAKAAHLATQAYEAARNTLGLVHVPVLTRVFTPAITSGAPIGVDGRVVDTPEVAEAKAAHLAAHALEAAKKHGMYPYGALAYSGIPYAYRYDYGASLGPDGRVIDTPKVADGESKHLTAVQKMRQMLRKSD